MVPSKTAQTSNLIAVNTNISLYPGFSEKQKKYVLAKTGNRVRVLVKEKKKNLLIIELVKAISSAVFDCGQKMDAKDLELNANNLANYLDEKFPAITIQEVQLAFKMGAVGEFGEFMGLNLKTFNYWIKCYFESEEVKKAYRIQLDYQESLKSEQQVLDQLRTEELNKQAAETMIKEFRENHNNISGLQLFIFKQWAESYHDKNIENFPHDLDLENEALENVLQEKSNKSAFNRTESEKNKNDFNKVKIEMFENKEVQTEYKFLRVKKWILG